MTTSTSSTEEPWLPLPAEAWDEPGEDGPRPEDDRGRHDTPLS